MSTLINCKGRCADGKPCKYKGRVSFEGLHYCKLHCPVGECPICFENMTQRSNYKLECTHQMHIDCLRKWLEKGNQTCPLCRASLSAHDLAIINPRFLHTENKSITVSVHQLSAEHLQTMLSHDSAVEYLRQLMNALHSSSNESQQGSSNNAAIANALYTLTLLA